LVLQRHICHHARIRAARWVDGVDRFLLLRPGLLIVHLFHDQIARVGIPQLADHVVAEGRAGQQHLRFLDGWLILGWITGGWIA
jgi:hypothetical protein